MHRPVTVAVKKEATGRTMVNEHFLDLTHGVPFQSPFIWECTRFCLAPGAGANVSAALMLGVLEAGLNAYLTHVAGVFDARMIRVYRRVGWGPTILGTDGTGRDAISAGLWPCDESYRARLLSKAGVTAEVSDHWYARAFVPLGTRLAAVA